MWFSSCFFALQVIQKLLEHGTSEQRIQLLISLALVVPSEGQSDAPSPREEDDPSHGDLSAIARHTYACRVLQRALNYVTRRQAASLAVRLLLASSKDSQTTEDHVRTLATDQNANHVLQKFVAVLAPSSDEKEPQQPCLEANAALMTLVQAFSTRVHLLATHAYACRVLQRLLERLPARTTRPLVNEVRADALKLMQDAYGNYVVQWLLQRTPRDLNATPSQLGQAAKLANGEEDEEIQAITKDHEVVLRLVLDSATPPDAQGETGGLHRFVRLARHKFASNVLEYVASTSKQHTPGHAVPRASGPDAEPGAFFRLILDILLAPAPTEEKTVSSEGPDDPKAPTLSPTVVVLLHDQYANYVLQRVLNLVDAGNKAKLAQVIRPALRVPNAASSTQSRAAAAAKPLSSGSSPLLSDPLPGLAGQPSFASAAAVALQSSTSSPSPGTTASPAPPSGKTVGSPALAHASAGVAKETTPGLPPSPHGYTRARPRMPIGTDHPPKHIATIERLLEV